MARRRDRNQGDDGEPAGTSPPLRRQYPRLRDRSHTDDFTVLSRLFHDVHAELALGGTHTDLVLSTTTIERARDLNPAEFEIVVSVDVLDLYRYPGNLSFGLTLGERCTLLGAYDPDGRLHACVESTEPAFYRWGEQLFEQYREQSERIESPLSLPFDLGSRE